MCGIAGGAGEDIARHAGPEALRAMIGALRHRGPDGFGYHEAPGVALAHARLSIIDLSTGDQPIRNETGTVQVVFNGEIFNYIELRAELEAQGHRFYTHSDTEVIVHLYEQHGDAFVSHLNGQFAIALWDAPAQRLVLARDRSGIRPLFYTRRGNSLLFASEVKSLVAAVPALGEFDPAGLSQVYTWWATLGERTVFRDVLALPPGHLLSFQRGEARVSRYWDWDFAGEPSPAGFDLDAAADELQALLTDAVRLQLRADVPVGAYLSGGLDSSAIVALVRKLDVARLSTFSVAFDDAEFDESAHQAEMVKFLGTEHHVIRARTQDIGAAFPRLIHHCEVPVVRTAPVPLMLLSESVRAAGFKVVLTGEGADEVFGGYDLFKEAAIRRFWARQPASTARPRLLTRLYPYLKHSPVASAGFASGFFGQQLGEVDLPQYAHLSRIQATRRLLQLSSPGIRAAALDPAADLGAILPTGFPSWSGLARDQYVESATLMSGYLLAAQGDRVAMANSIEGRVPFLDHRVIEFAARLPARARLRTLREKWILRRAMRGLLPDDILQRAKQPYRAPDSASFFTAGQPLGYVAAAFEPAHLADAGIFDPAMARRVYEKCRAGRAIGFADNMAFVGMLSTLLLADTVRGWRGQARRLA